MEIGVIVMVAGALLGLWGCDTINTARSGDAHSDDGNGIPKGDASKDASRDVEGFDAGNDVYIDGGGDGNSDDRSGINDAYTPLPFCSGRNIFTIKGSAGIGFCSEDPTTLYQFPISKDLSSVMAESLLELPGEIGGRAVSPTTIRDGGPEKVLISMRNLAADTSASYLMFDLSTGEFVGPQVSATGLQIGTNPIGDPVPIGGLYDLAFIGAEFWGVLSNPNEDGSYRFGFGLALPQTEEGLVDLGVEPNEEGLVENILSDREESHFSFRTTYQKPTNVEDLGGGLIAIQTGGTLEEPSSIDVASVETHQLLEDRNVSLGMRELSILPRFAVFADSLMAYPATATSLWEVDLNEGAPSEQENEMPLAESLSGEIASVVILGGQVVVGDSDGQILFVDLSEASWGTIVRTIDVGSGLSNLAVDDSGHLFASVEATVEEETPHIVAIDPALLSD